MPLDPVCSQPSDQDYSGDKHVRSEHNSADLASRGVSLRELVHSQLWWEGPD